ncbi:efflux RND transporter periplasmic adaptor subunit [Brevundimonas sp. WCHBH090558]|uniref:efflux RND transporter periplasmic adaptor subunit n=1 Tax=Brevundimonas huaxiensis TaxID=2725493 RepID=UPI00162559C2|nr:efflux RND transporter periplasmic adaptor subunit [Brevundimonas huaxiensis]MBC1183140.1 efflux RND transporter periplasmic adaptor subunit [Brevundimonas huaxiensis]
MSKTTRTVFNFGAVALSALLLASCGGHGEEKKDEKAAGGSRQTVSAATVTQTSLDRTVTASGTVSAWEEVPVAAETGGLTAVAVYVDEGSYVRQGQPLVQMNDVLLRAQLRQQQAQVQLAEANVARDNAALDRAQQLKERGFLSQASLDTALANQRSSNANLAAARAALSQTQTQLSQATIRAPVSGLIVSRSVTKGQIIAAGTELFRMVRDGRLELDAQVPETELALVRTGQSATITSSEAGQTTGSVRIVTPEVNATTRLGLARISLAPGAQLRPGMFARADIAVGDQPATTVPTGAVLYRDNKPGVFVVRGDSTVHFQPVTILSRTEAQTAVSGVDVGVRVAVDGAGFLNEGDRVNVAQAVGNAPAPAAQPATK